MLRQPIDVAGLSMFLGFAQEVDRLGRAARLIRVVGRDDYFNVDDGDNRVQCFTASGARLE